ncbi:SMG7-like protein, partial [Tanacetum coccineum]
MLLTKTADHWIRLALRLPVFLKPKMWDRRGLEDVIGFPKFFDIHVFVKEKGECKSQDYTAARSYYLQPASLWPASGNPHHQFAILANYLGDDLLTIYRYFWSLRTEVIRMKTLKEDQRQLKGLPRVRCPTAAARNRRRPSIFQTTAQLDCAAKSVANGHGEYGRAPDVNQE